MLQISKTTVHEETQSLSFWRDMLRFLYWIFFKPLTLRTHIGRIVPHLPMEYSFFEARHEWDHNRSLRRLVWQSILLMMLAPPLPALLTLLAVSYLTDSPIYWLGFVVGVLGGIVGGLAGGITGSSLGGMTPGIAGGVAGSITFAAAGGLVFGVIEGVNFMIVFGVAGGTAFGISGGIAFGVYGGVVKGLLRGLALSLTIGLAIGITVWQAVNTIAGLSFGISFAASFLLVYGRAYYPLLLLYTKFGVAEAAAKPQRAADILRRMPHRWDETIWFPLYGLDELIHQVGREERGRAIEEIEILANSLGQRAIARRALVDTTADLLAKPASVPEIVQSFETIDWLPNNLSSISADLAEIFPRLRRMAQDLSLLTTAETNGSSRSRRLTLQRVLKEAEALEKGLITLSPRAQNRWLPVLERWQEILEKEQTQTVALSGWSGIENPYEAGNPLQIQRAALFKGRYDLRDQVAGALREYGRPTIVLTGPRRMGKTSFLRQLPRLLPGSTLPVFVDLQRPVATANDASFLYSLCREIYRQARPRNIILNTPDEPFFQQSPFVAFENWLEIAYGRLKDYKILLTFDEFEKVGEALRAQRLSTQVLDELRYSIQHRDRIAFLFAGVQSLDELGPNWSSYFINVRVLHINYLSRDETEDLVRWPDPDAKDFILTFDDVVVEQIYQLTKGHPYLIQLVCSCIVEEANAFRTSFVNSHLLTKGLKLALDRGEPYFRNVWDEMAGSEGQSILQHLAQTDKATPLHLESETLQQALKRMVRRRVVTKLSDSFYKVELPLVGRWVREKAPV